MILYALKNRQTNNILYYTINEDRKKVENQIKNSNSKNLFIIKLELKELINF